jgi:hypothetical protein
MVVFSAIHSRLHNSMGKLLKVLHRLNATYLEDDDVVRQTGEAMTFKADFDAPDDVIPVSDPEIFSELQRISQVQTIAQRAQLFPQLYDQRKVENTILKMMKITNPEQYLLPKPEPKPLNAVNENIAASLGQPIVAFPDQDHLAHIQSHLGFLEDPLFGANPLMAGTAIGPILQNVKEHMLFWYGTQIHKVASDAAGQDISQFMTIKDAEVQTKFDGMLAAATNVVHAQAQQFFGGLPPVIQKAQAMLQKFQQPPPMDPSAVAQQKIQSDEKMAQAKLQQQAQTDAQTAALKNAEIALEGKTQEAQMTADQQSDQLDAQNNQMDNHTKLQVAGANNQTKQQTVQAQNATKLTVTAEDNTTAETIAGAEMAAGKHTNIKDGTAVGKKPTEG